jgi:polysaccharide biosynthesis/export protein
MSLPDQPIGPDDLVAITVVDCPEISKSFRVSPDGSLSLPLLHQQIQAQNKMPAEVAKSIAAELKSEGFMVSPIVEVSVLEYRSRPISVGGAVRHPVSFQAIGATTLLDAISRAEGLLPDAASELIVTLPEPDPKTGQKKVIRIAVRNLMQHGDQAVNLPLHGGEEILVPKAGKIYVAGNVKKPGAYDMPEDSGTTLLKALALCEGTGPFATKEAYIYRKTANSGAREEVSVPLNAIVSRKAPDMVLQDDDVLYVPESKGKRLTANALDRLTGFASATASGLLIWH